MWINQQAFISLAELDERNELVYQLNADDNGVYLFLISGELKIDDHILTKRDALGIQETNSISNNANKSSFLLLIEVPMKQ